MKFYITVVEKRFATVEVEADDPSQAIKLAKAAYNTNAICLDDPETIGDSVQFYDETEVWADSTAKDFFQRIDS
jgi:hypothetical protein